MPARKSDGRMWNAIGMILAGALAVTAFWRSRGATGFYDGHAYGMGEKIHRRYAWTALAFFAIFALSAFLHRDNVAPIGVGAVVLMAILYAASFLRGAIHEDE